MVDYQVIHYYTFFVTWLIRFLDMKQKETNLGIIDKIY